MNGIKKITRNRKGEDMLVDFWAILAFAIILLLFLVFFILSKNEVKNAELRVKFASSDAGYMLNSYLKSPSLVDGSKTNAEIIAEDALNDDFSRTEDSFKKFFTGVEKINAELEDDYIKHYALSNIKLCIYDSSDSFLAGYSFNVKTKTTTDLYLYCDILGSITNAKTMIPTRDSFIYVETVLFGNIISK